ncbi:MAG: bifunctional DNA-formamidopyrimidine glycosylase/DNA-(apurinic or apyrimidinic site) lyase [Microthrixaceae bacterium]
MPELPEVETIRRALAPELAGRTFTGGWGHPSAKFVGAPDAVGTTVRTVGRRGKYLLVDLTADGSDHPTGQLVVHLGMSGVLALAPPTAAPSERRPTDRHVRAWWTLDDGRTLVFNDVRRFGRLAVVPYGEHRSLATLANLGPEPFDPRFTPQVLRDGIAATSRTIKTALLSQRIVAGLGNIYADEALWRAGIDPRRRTGLGIERSVGLHRSIIDVLEEALTQGGTTLRDYRTLDGSTGNNQHRLQVYGRGGSACLRCGATLRTTVIDARTTTWCVGCQR